MSDDGMDEIWGLFEQESEDYLAQIEAGLSGSATDLENAEAMAALFRAFHSLKGVSASLGLSGVESIAHCGEDLLDMFRQGEARPDEASRELLLRAADALVDLREACLDTRSDVAADAGLIAALRQAKDQLKSGGAVSPAPPPAAAPAPQDPEPEPEPDPQPEPVIDDEDSEQAPAAQSRMAIQVSREPADPSEPEFQRDVVAGFDAVISAELGQLAEALESPTIDTLDNQALVSSMLAMREAASEVGYLGIVEVLSDILVTLEAGERLDRTALIRGLCVFIHRLRVLSDLADSGLSMENVDDSMSPHISHEARDVVDRLSVRGGASRDWELVGILARALGVYRISALARLASELTMLDDWRDRPGADDVVEDIRRESEVIAMEGLTVSSLDMSRAIYDRLRDAMALLLTNAGTAVAELRKSLGDEFFNSLSPAARNEAAEYLEAPGARLIEVRISLPDSEPSSGELLARLYQEKVISNRVLVDIDPDLYQFLVGTKKPAETLADALRALEVGEAVLQACSVLAETPGGAPAAAPAPRAAAPKASPAQPDTEEGPKLFVDDDKWDQALHHDWTPESGAFPTPFDTPAPKAAPKAAPKPGARAEAPLAPPEPAPAPPRPPAVHAPEVPAASADAGLPGEPGGARATAGGAVGGGSLRVSSTLIDSYLDNVAELRLCLSRLDQGAQEAGFAATSAELRSLATQSGARKAERLRDAAARIDDAGKVIANQIARAEATLRMLHSVTLDLRVVPISIVFGRMPRLVRDLARTLGKQVTLEIDDGDIQIDKSMVDALMEPMVHMIRNAMDHGIEQPEERVKAGKPEKATLTLRATQSGNVAQVMIAEDGRGLHTNRIRAKALERGLITDQDAARMSEREIHRQIFAPGFSTAAQITETSGRGVGMDVVLTTLRRLGGSIDIDSEEGEGTRFYMSFPVSAALQRIIVVSDGARDLGLPERAIIEVIEVDRNRIQTVGERDGIQHRDGFLTIRSIESMLGWETPEEAVGGKAFPVVIIGSPQRRIGVAVHRVKRRQEVFMKELHPALNSVDVLAGATVMGEGQPLLVLDPETLIAIAGG